jgi:hypothetical protein
MAQALKSVPEDERERAERKVKLRTLGNIRLIAELYKQDVVPEKILHACIQEMLGDGKSDPIEDNVEVGNAAARLFEKCKAAHLRLSHSQLREGPGQPH